MMDQQGRSLRAPFGRRGVTLIELVIASLLGVVILLALGQVDVSRVRMYEKNLKIGRRTTDPSRGESEAGWLLQRLMTDTKQADRVVLRDIHTLTDAEGNPVVDESGNPKRVSNRIQLRIPKRAATVAELRNPANYDWMEYRLDPQYEVDPRHERVLLYRNIATYDAQGNLVSSPSECEGIDDDFRDVTDLRVRYLDIAKPALGGDPFPEGKDNNILEIVVSSIENIKFGATTVPAISYANVNATCLTSLETGEDYCDSGSGLAPPMEPPCP